MLTAKLETEIQTLSRQEKFYLIQVLVRNLELEDSYRREQAFQLQENKLSKQQNISKAKAIDTFLVKWKGSLKGIDVDAAKYDYLQEKYQ